MALWSLLMETISIHALREEGDVDRKPGPGWYYLFLSTPSARRATLFNMATVDLAGHFYPRPPRGGRQPQRPDGRHLGYISIHALREEGDRG